MTEIFWRIFQENYISKHFVFHRYFKFLLVNTNRTWFRTHYLLYWLCKKRELIPDHFTNNFITKSLRFSYKVTTMLCSMGICRLLGNRTNLNTSVKREQSTIAPWYAHIRCTCLFFEKSGVRCFLLTLVWRFALCLITNCISSIISYNNECRVCYPLRLFSYWILKKKTFLPKRYQSILIKINVHLL